MAALDTVLDFVLSFKTGQKMGVWPTYVAAMDSTADTLLFSTCLGW